MYGETPSRHMLRSMLRMPRLVNPQGFFKEGLIFVF
jgi:hypothetical protein